MQPVVMGVSGSGKSTVAALLASRTGCALADGDDLHPASSITRMVAGRPRRALQAHGEGNNLIWQARTELHEAALLQAQD